MENTTFLILQTSSTFTKCCDYQGTWQPTREEVILHTQHDDEL